MLTTSGGSGILAADAVPRYGLQLAALSESTVEQLTAIVPAYGSVDNPVDVTATVMRERTLMGAAVAALAGPDGNPRFSAVARFVLARPWRIPQLVRLGRGLSVSTRAAAKAAVAAIRSR